MRLILFSVRKMTIWPCSYMPIPLSVNGEQRPRFTFHQKKKANYVIVMQQMASSYHSGNCVAAPEKVFSSPAGDSPSICPHCVHSGCLPTHTEPSQAPLALAGPHGQALYELSRDDNPLQLLDLLPTPSPIQTRAQFHLLKNWGKKEHLFSIRLLY